MAGKRKTRRRTPGEGSIFQRCERQYGCPPMETITQPDGTTKRVRPEHRCYGMWIGQLDVGWENGRRQYRTVSARSQARCVEKLDALKAKIEAAGGQLPDKRMRLREWLEYWLESVAAPKVRPNTIAGYRTDVKVHIAPVIGHHWLDKLSAEHVERFHAAMFAKEPKLSSTTVHKAHRTLVTALEVARRRGKIVRNPAEMVGGPGRASKSRESLTAGEAKTLLYTVERERLAARWLMALLTGARQGECTGLEWDRVLWDAHAIDVSWALDAIGYRHGCDNPHRCGAEYHRYPCPDPCPKAARKAGRRHVCLTKASPRLCEDDCTRHAKACPDRELDVDTRNYEHRQLDGTLCLVRPKTETSMRMVPMIPPFEAALRQRYDGYLLERQHYTVDHGLVWARPDGRPLIAKDDTAAWKAACARADVPVVDLHAARNTTATLLRRAKVDVKVGQQLLGHAAEEMTRHYQDVDLTDTAEAMAKLAKLIDIPEIGK